MIRRSHVGAALAAALILAGDPAWAQFTWSGCPNVTANDPNFRFTTLVRRGSPPDADLWEPVALDFDMDANGNVDVYYVEMDGRTHAEDPAVKRYNAATNTVTLLARLPAWAGPYGCITNCRGRGGGDTEEGVTGIVLDPNFKNNRWLYVHWSPDAANVYRVSRFTVTGNTLDLASERVVIDIPAQRNDCCHTGGGLAFDAYGDLWISQGNNGGRGVNRSGPTGIGISETTKHNSDEWGASSTGGLRGGILRIHPMPSGTPAYTSPPGNFRDYYGSRGFDATKIRPEIFTKGSRNCYRLGIDPVRRWVGFSDVGPDAATVSGSNQHEEFNLRTAPGFMGWPYFVGNNLQYSGNKTAATPTNTSKWNAELNGLTTLPPAQAAFYPLGQSAGTGVSLYRYDGDLQSSVKFPPHFTRKWFFSNWGNGSISVISTNEDGSQMVGSAQQIFTNYNKNGLVDGKFGPDGAFYVVHYNGFFGSDGSNTRIDKITYVGTCRPSEPKLERPVPIANPGIGAGTPARAGWVLHNTAGGPRAYQVPAGMTGFEMRDLMGKKVWEIRGLRPGQKFELPRDLRRGVFRFRWIAAGI